MDDCPAPADAPDWYAGFRSPPAADRPQPLWSWNADLDEVRIDEQVAQFAAQGCGGVFIHPRPGLVTEYLSPRWFVLWRHAARRCAEHGIACHIYDENSFPSGFAGGHVVAAAPHTAARYLRAIRLETPAAPAGALAACADPVSGAALPVEAWRQAAPGRPVLAIILATGEPSAWLAGFPLPDISLPGTAEAFLASTHEAYAREAGGHFGATTRLVFTDEPTLLRIKDGIPWSAHLAEAFAAEHGYRCEERLGLLFADGPGHQAVRRDYHATMNRLVCEGFFRRIHDWCADHGLAATGHLDEHLWPSPAFLPSAAAALRWMQVPGNDLLGFQFRPDDPGHPGMAMARLNLRELDSVARQCARARSLVESGGGGGYAYGPAQMKRLEDFALAHGVTLVDPHLAHASLAGMRKYDWPQSLSDHSPWWRDYRGHADHLARAVHALRQGRCERRILVLMPTTSAWLVARPGLPEDGPLAAIRRDTLALVAQLEQAGLDYDLGDESLLAELGRVEGGALHLGACRYQALVLPAAMANWEPSTHALAAAALAAGVALHAEAGARPAFVAGRPDPRPAALAALPGWHDHADAAALAAALRRELPPQLAAADGGSLPPGLVWRRIEDGDGPLFWLCNPWDQPLETALLLPGAGLQRLDTGDGALHGVATRPVPGGQVADLRLEPGGHRLWRCRPAPAAASVAPAWRALAPAPAGIAADHDNALVLDLGELRIAGGEPLCASLPRLDTALWRAMGFAGCAWNAAIQHRRAILDHDVGALPGFTLTYRVLLDGDADPAGIRLAVEQPWLYRVEVNGAEVAGWERWFDPAIAAAPVGRLLRPGSNAITLSAARFSTRHELAPAWLLGGFALRPTADGFAIAPPLVLGLGSWRSLGRPLACGTMTYAWEVACPVPLRRLRLRLPAWAGATWSARLDGALLGRAVHGQDALEAAVALAAGTHRLAIRIAGHPAGLLGPHHAEGLPGRWTWERPWEPLADQRTPGERWRAPAAGLLAPPEVLAG
jgi:hypothetical protein